MNWNTPNLPNIYSNLLPKTNEGREAARIIREAHRLGSSAKDVSDKSRIASARRKLIAALKIVASVHAKNEKNPIALTNLVYKKANEYWRLGGMSEDMFVSSLVDALVKPKKEKKEKSHAEAN